MITPPTLTATTFLKQFPTGRTKPCVFECVDHDGAPAGDYVVKLWANMEVPAVASMSEMVGALLAEELGLNVPAPAFIEIDPALADVVQELDVRQSVRGSAGINFGSAYKSGGYSAWQPGRRVPDGMHKQAFEVFAFDALIDNPDRRREKPNLLENGEEVVVIDHELAFSFIYELFPSSTPWELAKADHLYKHIFYADLQRLIIQSGRIRKAVAGFTRSHWDELEGILPDAWRSDRCEKVRDHLLGIISTDCAIASRPKQRGL